MSEFHLDVGHSASFTKTVSESDVYMFAGITGDLAPNHVNKVYMENSSYGKLMAHGALIVGYMSTVSTLAIQHTRDADETPVALGFDRIRFIKPPMSLSIARSRGVSALLTSPSSAILP